jgi:hypothetical protein
VVSRALNDPWPLACHRPAGPDGSPDLRAILGVPDGITDPVLGSPQLRRRINAGRYPLLVALELARELGDPRAEQWARLVDAKGPALAMAVRWLAERAPEQDRLAQIDVRSRGQRGACRP